MSKKRGAGLQNGKQNYLGWFAPASGMWSAWWDVTCNSDYVILYPLDPRALIEILIFVCIGLFCGRTSSEVCLYYKQGRQLKS